MLLYKRNRTKRSPSGEKDPTQKSIPLQGQKRNGTWIRMDFERKDKRHRLQKERLTNDVR
jgi:hypothetical protein